MEVAQLFTDDTTASATYYRPSVVQAPEIEIMRAILEDALACVGFPIWLVGAKPKHNNSMTAKRADAIKWIETTNEDWLYSFNSICEHLGLHVDKTREAARQYYTQRGLDWFEALAAALRAAKDADRAVRRQAYRARRSEKRRTICQECGEPNTRGHWHRHDEPRYCNNGDGGKHYAFGLCEACWKIDYRQRVASMYNRAAVA